MPPERKNVPKVVSANFGTFPTEMKHALKCRGINKVV
jgi:hypothetical protein